MRVPQDRFVRLFTLEDSFGAEETVGPLESGDAAASCGQAARTDRVRVDSRATQTGSDRRGGARRRTAGDETVVPRITYWTKQALQAGRSHPERVHIHLANDDRAGSLQSLHADGVDSWNAILERLERSGRCDAGCIVEVLDADGHAVERTSPLTALGLLVRLASLIERLIRQDHGKRVQPRIQ